MNKQEFNRLAAEFIFKDGKHKSLNYYQFNPYDDANDLCLLEEKLGIDTNQSIPGGLFRSFCFEPYPGLYPDICEGTGKTPHESRRACAEEYLKEWKSEGR